MSAHVTPEQFDRLRAGTLPPAAVAEMGRHAAACAMCRDAIEDALALSRSIRDLRDQIEADTDFEDLPLESLTRRPPRWPRYAIAASIAALLLVLPWLLRRPEPATPPLPVATTTRPITPPPPAPAVAGYGRDEWDRWVSEVRTTRELPVPAVIEELRSPATTLRGATDKDDLALRPNHTVVADRRPRFRWAKRGAATYNVILRAGERIVESGPLTGTEWRSPVALNRGEEYSWQLEVTSGDERSLHPRSPDAPARFRVLDQSAFEEIADARKQHPDDSLLHIVLLARHGLRDEVAASLEQLAGSDASLAEALRASLRQWPR